MAIKVGINGYGRIGRNILRALYESKRNNEIQIVAVNDLGDAQTNAHLTQYDTAHGKFPGTVSVEGDSIVVNGDKIKVFAQRDPSKIDWASVGAEYVFESTGFFTTKADAGKHLAGGAKKVVISAPGGKDVDATIVYGGRPEVRGREAIRDFFAAFPVQHARQFVHQHVVQTDGRTGRGHSYLDGRPVKDGKSWYVVGRFDDEYVRIDGAWFFQRVVLTVHYMIEPGQGWDAHLPRQLPAEGPR